MALIEGFRVQNYRSLRDVTLGQVPGEIGGAPLSPLTAVIGKNGSGKSTLIDAFGFLADCVSVGVEAACDRDHRGGFERLRSQGVNAPINFTVRYRESHDHSPILYQLLIDTDKTGRPSVDVEALSQENPQFGSHQGGAFLLLSHGEGSVWPGDRPIGPDTVTRVALTDSRQLGIASLGSFRDHPHISRFRDFIKGWYLSYFTPDAARSLPTAGPQRHLSTHGDNIGNVVQFMERDNKERFQSVLRANRRADSRNRKDRNKGHRGQSGPAALQ